MQQDHEEQFDELKLILTEVLAEQHIGPLPAPRDLAMYNNVVPGAGDRILKMAESDLAFRQEQHKQDSATHSREIRRGQYLAWSLGVLGLLCATYLGLEGSGILAVGLAVAGVSSIMSQVLARRRK